MCEYRFPVISVSVCILSIIFALLFSGAPVGDDQSHSLAHSIKGLQITSGNRTYRIPSPTRPSLSRNSFQQQESDDAASLPSAHEADLSGDGNTEKGFYISFESDAAPKRPKPPLRVKRSSPKKVRFKKWSVRIAVQRELHELYIRNDTVSVVTAVQGAWFCVQFPVRSRDFSYLNIENSCGVHPVGTGNSVTGVSSWATKLTSDLRLMPRLRMRGSVLAFALCAFMVRTGTM